MIKKFFLLAVIAAMLTTAVLAATGPEVNRTVQNAFRKQFGDRTLVSWKKLNAAEIYVGQYLKDGVRKEAFFDLDGKLIGEGQYVSTQTLPVTIKKIAGKVFGKYEMTEAYEFYYVGSDIPVYGLVVENEKEKFQLRLDEFGNLSVINRMKQKNTSVQNQSVLKASEGFDIEVFKD